MRYKGNALDLCLGYGTRDRYPEGSYTHEFCNVSNYDMKSR